MDEAKVTATGGSRVPEGPPDSLTTTDPVLIAMSRQAHQAILNRLTAEVLDAVAEGDTAVAEAARLSAWLRADFLPWTKDRENQSSDQSVRAALRSDRGVLIGLESLLAGSHGYDAANWTRQIHRSATVLLARLEYLEG
ncbi:MAG: hypothetical protein H6525_03005 [Actinobacteria bacterium]|nr:hypothetical protein [Actinomycetota bacterium]